MVSSRRQSSTPAGRLDGSLRRLKLERIDLYQLHRIDPKVPAHISFEFYPGHSNKVRSGILACLKYLIPGTSSVGHLEENMRAAKIVLDENDMTELDSLSVIQTSHSLT